MLNFKFERGIHSLPTREEAHRLTSKMGHQIEHEFHSDLEITTMETLAFNIAEKVLGRLASHAYQEISSALSVKVELDKLKETLRTITLVLQDAEKKQTTNPLITDWLRKLEDVCLDADDVLDDFEYQKLWMQVVNRSVKGKVCNFFSHRNSLCVRNKISHKIKSIRESLDYIDGEKNKYSLVPRDVGGDSQGAHKEVRDETSSHIQMSDVIGRDYEVKQIIDNILEDNSEGKDNVSVISIVGLGGLGKTTLAKSVYNNEMVVKEFELKMWVCVSDEFHNKRLICEIINQAPGQKCDINESLQRIQIKLQNALGGKKFLLVLDDVWDKEEVGVTNKKWNEFKTLLNIGGRGSKTIVTTRSENVAKLTGSKYVHQLKVLPHKHCMSLFKRMVFITRDEEQHNQHLMGIARDIVKKCGGVPLALATVGSSLRWKRDLRDWKSVRDNDIWKGEGILPALKLSYNALPPYLKPCFAYCSLFPKNFEFNSRQLIPLWMAEGYLQSSDNKQGFEEIGVDYTRQLCSRSLFQSIYDSGDDNFVQFQMHDLVHDLAISVVQTKCSSVNDRPTNPSKRVRYVSLSLKDLFAEGKHVRESILQLHKVRTILIPERDDITTHSRSLFFKTCISRLEYLRVLVLCCSGLKVIPSSIGNLSHLRYLNLSYLTIEKLPNSICKLYNLESLGLHGCVKLKDLPKDIGNLINLKYFEVCAQQMQVLPEGLKCFTSLQSLYIFFCPHLKSLGEGIQCLTNLRRLNIKGCPELIKRCSKEGGKDWPKIAHVSKVILDGVDVQSMDKEDTTKN